MSRVKVTAGAFWDTNSTGDRVIRVVKNGASGDGFPQQKAKGSGFTSQALTTATIEVNPTGGDTIGMVVYQDSGGTLSLINSGATFLSVEAMG